MLERSKVVSLHAQSPWFLLQLHIVFGNAGTISFLGLEGRKAGLPLSIVLLGQLAGS
jgi:hypothetical protein